MKRWTLSLALALCGCGGSDTPATNNLVGTWTGSLSNWSVTLVVDQAVASGGTTALLGSLSTNNTACFNSAPMSALLTNASIDIAATGAGSASRSIIRIDGQLSDKTITGYIEITDLGDDAQCTVARTPITITRQ